jgi:hypothetical protein
LATQDLEGDDDDLEEDEADEDLFAGGVDEGLHWVVIGC